MKKAWFLIPIFCSLLVSCQTTSNGNGNGNGKNMNAAMTDDDISMQVREELKYDGSLSYNARNLDIYTENGAVTLCGKVASNKEKSDIVTKVRKMKGVRRVIDRIEVVGQ